MTSFTLLGPVTVERDATAAKRAFVDAFDPLARRFGERTWSASEL